MPNLQITLCIRFLGMLKQIQRLKTTQMYSSTVLSPKSHWWQGHAPSETCRGGSFLAFYIFQFAGNYDIHFLVATPLQSLLHHQLAIFSPSVSVFLGGCQLYGLSPPYSSVTLSQLITSAMTLFPNKVHSENSAVDFNMPFQKTQFNP